MKLLIISEDEWEKVSNEVVYSTGGKRKLRRAMTEVDTVAMMASVVLGSFGAGWRSALENIEDKLEEGK
jgi:hypothetical protein